jgi:hypothetical protein
MYVALAVRLNSSYPNGTIKPLNLSFSFSGTAGKNGYYELQLHTNSLAGSKGSISGSALSYTSLTDSIAQYAVGSGQTLSTSGYILTSGFVQARSNVSFSANDYETLLTRHVCTQYDTLYIFVTSNDNGSSISASIDFIESI